MASDFYLDNPVVAGKSNSPTGALKKAGVIGANPAGQESMFNGPAIMDALGYGKNSGGIDIGIAGGAPGNRVQPVAQDTLAAIKAKDAQITNTPTVPTIAGITPGMVQRPSTQMVSNNTPSQPTPAIAGKQLPVGVNQFDFSKKAPAGGVVANGSVNDLSATSPLAIASTMVDDRGRTYDEQVAHAQEVNANTMRQLQNPTDKQKFDMTFVGKADSGNPSYRNAMMDRKVWEDSNKNNQADLTRQNAQDIAGIHADAQNYTDDQNLAGHKYTADANVKAHEVQAIAGVEKAKIAGVEKAKEQGQKDRSAFQQKVYDQTMKSYDFSGMAPTAAHEFATIMARTAGQGYVAVKSPDGKSGDLLVHPELSKLFSPERMAAAQKDPRLFQQLLDMAHKAGGGKGVERLPIKNIDQLKLIKTAEPLPGVPTIAG